MRVLRLLARLLIGLIVATAAIGGSAAAEEAVDSSADLTSDPQPIVGGLEAPEDKYGFAVALVDVANQQFCGGSLIAPTWVLTAAHCFTDGSGAQDVGVTQVDVIVGRHDLNDADGEQIDVVGITLHPNWMNPGNFTFLDDDIALVELATAATVGALIPLAQTADAALWADGQPGTVVGWGSTVDSFPYNSSDTLMEVGVPFRDDTVCTGAWGAPPSYTPPTDICAGGAAGEDSCVGDSGGPIFGPTGLGPWTLVGIVSGGAPVCGTVGIPAVYTEVAAYLTWINGIADTSPPTVTVEQSATQADPTPDAPISFTVTFSEPVSGFETGDVTLGGTAGATTAVVSGAGPVYDVEVTGMTTDGTVLATVGAGAATDTAGNVSTASTSTDNVVVYDMTPPVIAVPDTVTVNNDPGQNGAAVPFTVTATDEVIGDDARLTGADDDPAGELVVPAIVTCSAVSGSFFPIGSTTVTCTATDTAGNTSDASFLVVVVDNEAPVIAAPGTIQVVIPAAPSGPMYYDPPAATDNSLSAVVTCAPPSGTVVQIGTTTVSCTATDPSGNTAVATFDVIVTAPELPATGRGLGVAWIGAILLLSGVGLLVASRAGRARARLFPTS